MSYPTDPCSLSTYLDSVLDIYVDEVLPDLDSVRIALRKSLEDFFVSLKTSTSFDDLSLFYSNSAYSGHYFSFSTRSKSLTSLREKLIRNDSILHLQKKFPVVNNSVSDIKNYLYTLDDLIGIKIVGELEEDVKQIIKIIDKNKDDFETICNFRILSKETSTQARMRNGMYIYKLKCEYIKEDLVYPFEFQVKSKLMSAWGDMEHQMFYKDRLNYFVKDSSQDVMNKVGNMIIGIDDLLYSIRTSKSKFETTKELTLFIVFLQERFGKIIRDNLTSDTDISLDSVAKILADLEIVSEKFGEEDKDEEKKNIFFEIWGQDSGEFSDIAKSFIEMSSVSFKIKTLEYLYSMYYFSENDIRSADTVKKIEVLENLINDYRTLILKRLNLAAIDLDLIDLESIVNHILSKIYTQDVWLLAPEYGQISSFLSNCIDEAKEIYIGQNSKSPFLEVEADLMPIFTNSFDEASEEGPDESKLFNLNSILALTSLYLFDSSVINRLNVETDEFYKNVVENVEMAITFIESIEKKLLDMTFDVTDESARENMESILLKKIKKFDEEIKSLLIGRE